jgi:hypothetical protein
MKLFDASRNLYAQGSKCSRLDSYVIVFTSALPPTKGGNAVS